MPNALRSFLSAPTPAPAGRPAVHCPVIGRWLGYGELRARVEALAHVLAPPGRSLVFLFSSNSLGSLVAYLAAVEAGHAVALLDAGMRPALKRQLIMHYRPTWILEAGDDPHGDVGAAVAGTGIATWRTAWQAEPVPHPDLAVLLTTSGSTGSPKLVRLSRANIESNAASIALALGIDADERAVTSLPLHYAYGLSVVNSHLWAGAAIALTSDSVMGRPFWQALEDLRCTSFAGVPYTYQMLERIGFGGLAVPHLRTLTQAGGKLDERLVKVFHERMQARGGRFVPMYGQTEATARIAILDPSRLPEKLGTAGRAVPGGHLAIVDEDGRLAVPGVRGRVIYHGPNVMMGYASERADLAKGDELGGCLATGDLGRLDAEGFLTLCGREKRIAKLYGLRVNLDDVEELLSAHGPVAAIENDERLVVFCEKADAALLRELGRRLAGELGLPVAALAMRHVTALPVTAAGKIDYRALWGIAS